MSYTAPDFVDDVVALCRALGVSMPTHESGGGDDVDLEALFVCVVRPTIAEHTKQRREQATQLAALRYWQREGLGSAGREQDIATDCGYLTPLTYSEIEELVDRTTP